MLNGKKVIYNTRTNNPSSPYPEFSSRIIDSMNRRKGQLIELKDTGKGKKRLIFHAPTRGLMGYTSRFLTLTKGTGVINRTFHSFSHTCGKYHKRC